MTIMIQVQHSFDQTTSNSSFSFTSGVVILFATTSVLVFGALCAYIKKLCRRIRTKKKRGIVSKRRSARGPRDSRENPTQCPAGAKPKAVSVSPQFIIPKTRTQVLQQPAPQFTQSRMGDVDNEKRISLVSMYFTEENLGDLDPTLYKTQDNVITVGINRKLGQLNFSLKYNSKNRKLTVTLFCGKDYPARDFSGSVDTCVTVCVLPNRDLRKQTAIHRRSTNPTYNENFVFTVAVNDDVYSHSVLFVVFYYDQVSHSKVLGEAQVPLVELDLSTETVVWCYLQEGSARSLPMQALQTFAHKHADVGDVLLSLCFSPKDSTLSVAVLKTSNLSQSLVSSEEKIYAKASLLHEGQKLFKRKTNLQSVDWKYTVFNEALLFRVPEETLKQSTLRVSLNRYNVVGRSSTIGEVIFGPSSSAGPESTHWWDMLARPDKPVSMWHTLHGFTFMEGSRDTAAPPSPS